MKATQITSRSGSTFPLILILCLAAAVARADAPTFSWVRKAGGTGTDYGTGLATDVAGNTFVFAKYGSNFASLGSLTVSNSEYFLAKYDPDGTALWVRPIGFPSYSPNLALNYRLGCDAAGNVYLGGSFFGGKIIFGGVNLTNLPNPSLFLAKYDSSGNFAWATNGLRGF